MMQETQSHVFNLTIMFNAELESKGLDEKRAALIDLIDIIEHFNNHQFNSPEDINLTEAVHPFFSMNNDVGATFEWQIASDRMMAVNYYILRTKGFVGKTPEGRFII